jgi:hypothetical protein
VGPGPGRRHPAPGRAQDQAALQEEGLVGVLDGVGLLAHALGQRGQPDRLAPEAAAQRLEDGPVHLVQAELVHPEEVEALGRRRSVDGAVAPHLGEVADPAQQAVGHAGRAPRALGDPRRPLLVDLDLQDPGRALDDGPQVGRRVEVEAADEAEAVAQRPETRPVRVVAPTRVKRGRSSRMERAVGPLPMRMSSLASSMAE